MVEIQQDDSSQMLERIPARRQRTRIPAIYFAAALLLLLVLLFTLGNRHFLSAYNLNTIASYSAILLVVGLGQMCPILIGGIDLSVGGLMSFVSVVFIVAVKAIGIWAFPVCLLAGAIVGLINGLILTRIKIPSFIATLGTGGILTSLALLVSPLPVDVPAPVYGIAGSGERDDDGDPKLFVPDRRDFPVLLFNTQVYHRGPQHLLYRQQH